MSTVIAALRLAGDDPQAAAVARSRPSSPPPPWQAIPSDWWTDSCWSELSMTPETASVPVSAIVARLGVCTRTEAAATVRRMHVLDGR
jgi:hypothetical protein